MRRSERFTALLGTAMRIVQREGIFSVLSRLVHWLRGERGYHRQLDPIALTYAQFKRRTTLSHRTLKRQMAEAAAWNQASPRVTLITLFRGKGDISVTSVSLSIQTYSNWRWLIFTRSPSIHSDDARIEVIVRDDADDLLWGVNQRLQLAKRREYAGFIEAGDSLTPDALYEMVKAVRQTPGVEVVYSDGETVEADGMGAEPVLKPDWSPEMMLSINLLSNFALFEADHLVEAGGVGSLDSVAGIWDMALRVGRSAKTIVHVPRILYQQVRGKPFSMEACAEVIREHLQAADANQPEVLFVAESGSDGLRSVCQWMPREDRLISIIIPTRDLPDVLRACLESIFSRTSGGRYEVIVMDTGSTDPAIMTLYEQYAARANFRVIHDDAPFNFSRVCNAGAKEAQGDLLLFLNNDTEVLTGDWLERMAQWFDLPGVGMVGAKLLYPNGMIQHAGVIVGIHGLADNFMAGLPEHSDSVFGSDDIYRNLSAVTGACMMVSREAFEQVGGFNERYHLNFSDVQLGVDINRAGYRIVYTPDVRLIHHESLTHQGRIPVEDIALGKVEMVDVIQRDPFYHPYLSRGTPRPMLSR